MQIQDYLLFFQNLIQQYYAFTLNNAIYASCLAIFVWLLTSILYSISINSLNKRLASSLKAGQVAEQALRAIQEEIPQLQAELAATKQQMEQETLLATKYQASITEFEKQLADSILAMAAQPDLGQQGLSATPGLTLDHLWQRYSAAVKLLAEDLLAYRQKNEALQLVNDAEIAKLSEANLQLQSLQLRYDSQKLKIDNLEAAVSQYQTQLTEQQALGQQRLSDIEAKHQLNLTRLATLEKQTSPFTETKPSVAITPVETVTAPVAPVPTAAPKVESVLTPTTLQTNAVDTETIAVADKPVSTGAELNIDLPKAEKTAGGLFGKLKNVIPNVGNPVKQPAKAQEAKAPIITEEPQTLSKPAPIPGEQTVQPEPKAPPAVDKTPKQANAGFGGKLLNIVNTAQQKFAKMDQALGFGEVHPQTEAKQPSEPEVIDEKPAEAPVNIEAPEQSENPFDFGEKETPKAAEKTVETPVGPTTEPVSERLADRGLQSQVKNLFGKFKGKR